MLKKCDGQTDGRTNERTDEQTDLCIELRYAQLKTEKQTYIYRQSSHSNVHCVPGSK